MTGRRELQVLWNTSVLKLSYEVHDQLIMEGTYISYMKENKKTLYVTVQIVH